MISVHETVVRDNYVVFSNRYYETFYYYNYLNSDLKINDDNWLTDTMPRNTTFTVSINISFHSTHKLQKITEYL